MIDQVVCTRGDIFVGTWFSTFTGYITRMRGYLGYPDTSVYFGDMAHRCVPRGPCCFVHASCVHPSTQRRVLYEILASGVTLNAFVDV
jgi:hypothetical protein